MLGVLQGLVDILASSAFRMDCKMQQPPLDPAAVMVFLLALAGNAFPLFILQG